MHVGTFSSAAPMRVGWVQNQEWADAKVELRSCNRNLSWSGKDSVIGLTLQMLFPKPTQQSWGQLLEEVFTLSGGAQHAWQLGK